MNNQVKIGVFEAISITTIAIINKVFFSITSVTIGKVGTSVWYMTIFSCLLSLLFFYITYTLLKRYPGKNITDISELVLGKLLGKIVNSVFCIYAILYTSVQLIEFVEMIKVYIFVRTPMSYIIIPFLIVVVLINTKGVEGIARTSAICFIPILIGLASLLLLAIQLYEPTYLQPVLGYGIKNTFFYGLIKGSMFAEFIFPAFFITSFKSVREYKKIGLISILISGLIISLIMLCCLMAFNYENGGNYVSALYQLSKAIYYNRFVQRVESIFLFIWIISCLLTVSIAFSVIINSYQKVFKIRNMYPLLIPFSLIVYTMCFIPKNIFEVVYLNVDILMYCGLIVSFLIPTIMLIISLFRKKKGGNASDEKKSKLIITHS